MWDKIEELDKKQEALIDMISKERGDAMEKNMRNNIRVGKFALLFYISIHRGVSFANDLRFFALGCICDHCGLFGESGVA